MSVRQYICPKTKKVRFEAYVNVRSKTLPTIRIQRYKKCATKLEARRAEKQLMRKAIEEVQKLEGKGKSWVMVITIWEAEALRWKRNPVTGTSMTEKAIKGKINLLRRWTEDWLELSAEDISRFQARAVIINAINAGLTKSTDKKIKSSINTVFDFGIQDQIILHAQRSPVFGLHIDLEDDEKAPEILTAEEVQILLKQARAQEHEWYPIWAMVLMTGMRSSEFYALKKRTS